MSIYLDILKKYWGYSAFRTLQEQIVESAGSGTDTLALMPTGGGKSITFQVPTMAKEGICLVVTPLIALMKDQVENLKARKIKAIAIHSGLSRDEISIALDNCIFGDVKFLYLSPERLSTDLFKVRVQQMNVTLVAIDEAHCISQWGYDFRPSYLKIAELREILPDVPFLALTATATPRVARDIMDRLEFKNGKLLQKSFERRNLAYVVRKTEDKYREMLKIANKIEGTGIIYARNRRNTKEIADLLQKNGLSAEYYHAGLKYESRMQRQEDWQLGRKRIMVSTNAFGMGIDKADVRFVIHMDLPDSPEAYFQEAGRAGRDGNDAWAVLLYSDSDEKKIEQRIDVNFPDFTVIREIYTALFNYLQVPVGGGKGLSLDFIMGEFLAGKSFNALTVTSALNILSQEGYFEITEEINNPSRIHFIVGRDELYKFQVKNPKFDAFIKLVLRSYTGLFSQYVAFDEFTLAKRAGMKQDEVYSFLVKLAGMKLINYIPKKGNPVITLLEERLEDKNVRISAERYRFRKERYIERIREMLEYAKTDSKCRSQFLLSYFGEIGADRCGICDVCRRSSKPILSAAELKRLKDKIILILQEEPAGVKSIAEKTGIEEELCIHALDSLLENGVIKRGLDLKFEMAR